MDADDTYTYSTQTSHLHHSKSTARILMVPVSERVRFRGLCSDLGLGAPGKLYERLVAARTR